LLRKDGATENQLKMSGVDKIDGAMSSSAEPDVANSERLPQQGLTRSIALHLLPGAVTTAIYIACVPAVTRAGYPPLAALLIASLVGLIPIELGILIFEGKRKNARWSLDGILLYREKWPISRYFTVVPVLVFICIVAYGISLPLDRVWAGAAFSWLPPWYVFTSVKQYAGFGRLALSVTFGVRIVVFLVISACRRCTFERISCHGYHALAYGRCFLIVPFTPSIISGCRPACPDYFSLPCRSLLRHGCPKITGSE
jgi:hypothetical protein